MKLNKRGRRELGRKNFHQWSKHAKLYSDLLEVLIDVDCEQREPSFLHPRYPCLACASGKMSSLQQLKTNVHFFFFFFFKERLRLVQPRLP